MLKLSFVSFWLCYCETMVGELFTVSRGTTTMFDKRFVGIVMIPTLRDGTLISRKFAGGISSASTLLDSLPNLTLRLKYRLVSPNVVVPDGGGSSGSTIDSIVLGGLGKGSGSLGALGRKLNKLQNDTNSFLSPTRKLDRRIEGLYGFIVS